MSRNRVVRTASWPAFVVGVLIMSAVFAVSIYGWWRMLTGH